MKKNYKLYKGDCLEIMKSIPDKSMDMILCDLPYGTTKCKWDTVIPLDKLWEQYNRIIKDNGAVVLFSSKPFTYNLMRSNLKNYRYDLIWEKSNTTGFLNAKRMPLRKHEEILFFYKKPPTYNPIMETRGKVRNKKSYNKRKGNGDSCYGAFKNIESRNNTYYPTSILKFGNSNQKEKLHPTQKPVELLEWLIKTYTNEGQVVLDNCMGSGSSGVAALNTNRKFMGIEKDENYFNIAKERIENTYNELLTICTCEN